MHGRTRPEIGGAECGLMFGEETQTGAERAPRTGEVAVGSPQHRRRQPGIGPPIGTAPMTGLGGGIEVPARRFGVARTEGHLCRCDVDVDRFGRPAECVEPLRQITRSADRVAMPGPLGSQEPLARRGTPPWSPSPCGPRR